jgi:hypothetical protein
MLIVQAVPVPPVVALPVPVVYPVVVPAEKSSKPVTIPQGAIEVTITCAPAPPTAHVSTSQTEYPVPPAVGSEAIAVIPEAIRTPVEIAKGTSKPLRAERIAHIPSSIDCPCIQ